jgi:type IV secretory pathway TrbD component
VTGVVLSWILSGLGVVITVVAVWRWIRDTRRDISELPLEH